MKNLLIVFILLIPFAGFTQSDLSENVKWSQLFETGKKVVAPTVIGEDGENIYLIRYIKKKKYIEKYSLNSLKLKKSLLLELEYNDKDLTLIDQFMFDEKPTLYTNFYNKKTKKSYFFIQTINPKTLILSKPKKVAEREIASSKGLMSGFGNSFRARYGAKMKRSENGELGIFWTGKHELAAPPKKNDPPLKTNEFIGATYDGDLKLLSEFEVKLPYQYFATTKSILSNDGIYYMLGYEFEYEEEKKLLRTKTVIQSGAMHVIIVDTESGEVETVDINTEEMEIEMMTFELLKNGGFQVAGLTTEETRGVSGAFAITFDAGFEETSNSVHRFEDDFIQTTWSDKSKKKLEKKNKKKDKKGKEKSLPVFFNYYIDHLIEKEDGTTTMLAEQYYVRVVTRTYTDSQGNTRTTTTYYYYYNDIIAVNFDAKGNFDWKTLVRKNQVSINDGGYYSSYFVVPNGDEINIVYNDSESSVENTEGMSAKEKKKLRRNYIGVQVTLDGDGEQTKGKLFEFTEEVRMRLVPKVCGEAGAKVAFLYAKGKKGDKLGTLTVD
ncbi:MAG: hypothetical protein ACI857_001865 [Arenicella sp.]|jgi:hypothetical protein